MTTLPATISDLDQVANVAFASSIDQQVQYRQVVLAFWNWLITLGGVVERSSNGTTVSNANNITTTADIVYAPEGTAHAWGIIRLGTTTRILVNCTNAAADTTPQTIDLYLCQVAYTGGTATARPTSSVADRESGSAMVFSIIPWATPVGGYYSYQWSATANIGWFLIKQAAATSGTFFMLERAYATDPISDGVYDWTFYQITSTNLPANGHVPGIDGTAGSITMGCWTDLNITGYTNGAASDGNVRIRPVQLGVNTATPEDARMIGTSRLLMYAPQNTPFNYVDPEDPVTDAWSWRTLNRHTVLWRKSDGNMA